ncbi:unnamed protein product [Owenia fusiformis]|uniref:Peregrin n=1 Tax=Owenia fusiformis TaxID=6347 RepID=A0A8S4NQJ0_OWEFU|nr:unnamed protein product [Owenia fusiformis]
MDRSASPDTGRGPKNLGFDLSLFCQNLKATKPPYECPVKGCQKMYKSFCGIQFHLYNYDHDNPDNNSPANSTGKKPGRKKGKFHHRSMRRSPTPPEFLRTPARETLTYAESQRLVEVDLEGRVHRINIYEPLEIITNDNAIEEIEVKEEIKPPKSPQKAKHVDGQKPRLDKPTAKLPEPSFKVLDDYARPPVTPTRPSAYYRYIEKSAEELDEEVEYDMDEEDYAWLELINDKRTKDNNMIVSQEIFEHLMDRFEKEAFFQSQTNGKDSAPNIDEDAVCSICNDGECQNSNVILFCDMCDLAVHQECYGVPYIPEGQWLCRRCLQSPSRAVDCCLCPNKGGAFKQTDDNRWAHVICSLWIPEVGFANTVFLEPIDSIVHIPPARWKLTCYICKQRSVGACIQCHKTNCYTAFHVTCAAQAGLYMKIEPIRDPTSPGLSPGSFSVRKTAYCDVHTPADTRFKPMINSADENEDKDSVSAKEAKLKSKQKMRKARKILAEKRNSLPAVSLPVIPQERVSKISSAISLPKKQAFIQRLLSYWTLKRQSRNGVPLLRRLQSNHMSRNKEQTKNDKQSNALKAQLKYWQRLRQDLEKARLLVELIRKREKYKREQIRLSELETEMRLRPFIMHIRSALDQIQEKDHMGIFAEPVDRDEVPDYYSFIKQPMDFATMRKKMNSHLYKTIDEFEADFDLVVSNCLAYNAKETVFYRAGVRMRDQGGAIIRATRRMIEKVGIVAETGLMTDEPPKPPTADPYILEDVDTFIHSDAREKLPLEEQLRVLLDKLDMAHMKPGRKSKVAKMIRMEIIKVRRKLAIQKGQAFLSEQECASSTECSDIEGDTKENIKHGSPRRSPSPLKGVRGAPRSPAPLAGTPRTTPKKPRGRPKGWRKKPKPEPELSVETELVTEKDEKVSPERPYTPSNQSSKSSNDGSNISASTPSPSTSGVNRRTAVLFSKIRKGPLHLSNKEEKDRAAITPTRKPGRPAKPKAVDVEMKEVKTPQISDEDVKPPATPKSPRPPSRGPTSPGPASRGPSSPGPRGPGSPGPISRGPASPQISKKRRKRSASNTGMLDIAPNSPVAKKPTSDSNMHLQPLSPKSPKSPRSPMRKESFLQYRQEPHLLSSCESDYSDVTSESSSASRSTGDSSSGTEGENEDGSHRYSRRARKNLHRNSDDELVTLEALDLVWAKCRGYPWYPALMINPKMPSTGYFHNGVPIPVPPEDVIALQANFSYPVYLVLFFDTKRTWQWLPRDKLEPLGVDSGLDKAKLLESKKPNVRKAVKRAYDKAIVHRCKVTGEPIPLSGDSEMDE